MAQRKPTRFAVPITHPKVSFYLPLNFMASLLKDSSTNAHNLRVLAASCEVNEVLQRISPRWKMQILHSIANYVQHFNQLKKALPSLSDQILSKRLGELVAEGLVDKQVVAATTPPQV